jgi:hypothetical protein
MSIIRYAWPCYRRAMERQAPWFMAHPRRSYIERCVVASPAWADRAEMRRLHREAKRLTAETGVLHTLDHEIPLAGRYVSGLNVPANLRVLRHDLNAHKSNHWLQHGHPDLFEEPEQFPLWERGVDEQVWRRNMGVP